MSGDLIQEVLIRVKTDGTHEIVKITGALDQLGAKATTTSTKGAALSNTLGGVGAASTGAIRPLDLLRTTLGGLGVAFTAAGAAAFLFSQARKGVGQALEAERILNRLSHAVRMTGVSFTEVAPRIERAVAQIFDMSRFDDEEARSALSRLIAMTGNLDQSLRALPVAANMAAAIGGDLESAVQQLISISAGAGRAFKQFGIDLTDTEEKAFQATDQFHRLEFALFKFKKIEGTFIEEMKGDYGEVIALQKRWSESWEDFGRLPLRAGVAISKYFDNIRSEIRKTLEDWNLLKRELGRFEPGGGRFRGHGASGEWEDPDAPPMPPATGNEISKWISDTAAFREQIASLSKNVSILTDHVGSETEAVISYAERLVATGDEANRLGQTLTAQMQRRVTLARQLSQAAGAVFNTYRGLGTEFDPSHGETEDELRTRLFSRTALKIPINPVIIPTALQRIGRELSAQLGVTFGSALTDIFADLAETGGRNFGEIASQALGAGIRSAAQAFGNVVIEALGGGQLQTNAAGEYVVGAQTFPNTPEGRQQAHTAQGQGIYGAIGQGIGGIAGLAGTVSNAGRQSDTSTVLGGLMSGASLGFAIGTIFPGIGNVIGTIVGAVVGLIVGGIAAIGSSSSDTDQYARVGVRDGRAFFENPQNITANESRAMQARLQDTFDTFRNGYIQILLQFPAQFRTGLMEVLRNSANIFPRLGLDAGGDLGTGGSLNFLKHFNEWVNGRLPRQIAETFFAPLATAFEGVGLSSGRFREIWDDLQDLDPRKAMELLGILAEGLIDIYETMNLFQMPSGFRGRYSETDPTTLRGRIQSRDQRSFAATLAETDEEIFSLAESLEMLTGEDQIRTVQRIGQLMQERYASEEEYIRSIMRMIEDSTREIDAAIRGYQLDSVTDPQGQVDYLTQYLEGLYTQLGAAGTPDAANRIYQEIFDTINQIAAIGGAVSPEDRQNYNAWAIAELQGLGTLYQSILLNFGTQLDAVNAAFTSRMGPMLDAFDGVAGVASGTAEALNGVAASGNSATESLYRFSAALDEAVASGEAEAALFVAQARLARVN